MLVPVVLLIGLRHRAGGHRAPLPLFVVGFAALVALNSAGAVPAVATGWLTTLSGWCLVTAIAALGVKTSLRSLVEVGSAPLLLLLGETVVLALWIGLGIALGY